MTAISIGNPMTTIEKSSRKNSHEINLQGWDID